MPKLSVPFKGFTVNNISQYYHADHRAWDIVGVKKSRGYGTPLCALEDKEVIMAIADGYTPKDTRNLARGYGVWMRGLETGLVYQYWHTLPYLPVNVGDIVKRGKIVAFMGNAGNVYQNGTYVPIENRLDAEKLGTHLHLVIFPKGHIPYKTIQKALDPMQYIDLSLQPTYTQMDLLAASAKSLLKMSNVLS